MMTQFDNWASERYFDQAAQLSGVRIKPSQLFVTAGSELMTTTLGSCVAVCLSDPVHRVYGMNHFMLPDPMRSDGPIGLNARYGAQSMELLINAMFKLGAERAWLTARVYGGAKLLQGMPDIGVKNVAFAVDFLHCEAIPVLSIDVGGEQAQCIRWRVPLRDPQVDRLNSLKSRHSQYSAEQGLIPSTVRSRPTLFADSGEVSRA
jgi:chemotaxis protein CheD